MDKRLTSLGSILRYLVIIVTKGWPILVFLFVYSCGFVLDTFGKFSRYIPTADPCGNQWVDYKHVCVCFLLLWMDRAVIHMPIPSEIRMYIVYCTYVRTYVRTYYVCSVHTYVHMYCIYLCMHTCICTYYVYI